MSADQTEALLAELADPPRDKRYGKHAPGRAHNTKGSKPLSKKVAKVYELAGRHASREKFLKGPWQKLLDAVSAGETAKAACARLDIDPGYMNSIVTTIPAAKVAWQAAQHHARRARWPLELMEEIMVDIAAGAIIKEAVEARGMKPNEFYYLALKDPEIKQMYDDAQQIRIESMAEAIIAVSDDAEQDFNEYGRLNSENINRAKLKVDTRKWLMSRLGWKRFGDRLQTEQNVNLVVDHAERLNAARKRVETLRSVPVIEAVDPTLVAVQ